MSKLQVPSKQHTQVNHNSVTIEFPFRLAMHKNGTELIYYDKSWQI